MFHSGEMHNGKAYVVESGNGRRMPSLKAAKVEAAKLNAITWQIIGREIVECSYRLQRAAALRAERRERDARRAHASPSFI